MDDKKLKLLVLTKLYELNRQGDKVSKHIFEQIDTDVSPEQLNFAFQYLGSSGLIDNSYSNSSGVYYFHPQYIKGKGIDLLENLVSKTVKATKNAAIINASTMLDKIVALVAQIMTQVDFFKTVIEIFDKLIATLQTVF